MKKACHHFPKRALVFGLFLMIFVNSLYAKSIDTIIFPAATVSFSIDNMEEHILSNAVKLKKASISSPSLPTLLFYKYDLKSKEFLSLSQTDYSDNGFLNGNFNPLSPLLIDGKKIDISKQIPAIKCLIYKRNEPLIVFYHDDRFKGKKSVCIRIETSRDKELIQVKKYLSDDVDDATFVGYINTTTDIAEKCDGQLYVEKGTQITASPSYHDSTKSRSLSDAALVTATAGVEIAPLQTKSIEKKSSLWLSSRASKKEAGSGEYIQYSIYLSNTGERDIHDLTMVNKLSKGIIYKEGSFLLDQRAIRDQSLSLAHSTVGFHLDELKVGEEKEIQFIVYVGILAHRQVSNDTFVSYDGTLSETASVSTKIKKASHAVNTIVGKIKTDDNVSLQGIRLYLENGTFVFTDRKGAYHFENIASREHVVAIDKQSLPEDVAVVSCVQNIRYGGSAFSQFVDLRHAAIQNADFCVKKRQVKKEQKRKKLAFKIQAKQTPKMPKFTSLDIAKSKENRAFLWPPKGYIPPMPSIKVAILHGEKERLELFLNNKAVDMLSFDGFVKDKAKKRRISKFRGLDLKKGDNLLRAKIYDSHQKLLKVLTRKVHLSTAPVRAELVLDKSYLVADGQHSAVLAVRMYDAAGYPLREGMVGTFSIEKPYISQDRIDELAKNPLAMTTLDDKFTISDGGIAYIKLRATSKSGEVKLHFPFQNDDEYIKAWLKPKAGKWFIAGFAKGSIGYKTLKDNLIKTNKEHYTHDGRIALFVKGKVKAGVLLSLAYDSGKESDLGLVEELDPDSYYTVYGDGTLQNHEAASAKKLYLKLEKDTFYTMFGDFDTGLDNTTLLKYTRRINGIKSEYKGKQFEYNAFATKTDHYFVKDEIKGDGTSGLYDLSNRDIVFSSERVKIEVRDRFRSEVIVESHNLTSILDYSIDYNNGTLYFKSPVLSADASGNPRYIVVDYEVAQGKKKTVTFGGRAAVKSPSNRAEIGASYIHEDHGSEDDSLYGFDARMKLNAKVTLKAEYAQSQKNSDQNSTTADAYLFEVTHKDRYLDAKGYFKKQAEGFGLKQQNQSENNRQKYGVEGVFEYWKQVAVKFAAYRDENLIEHTKRDVGEVKITYDNHNLMASLGYRYTGENSNAHGQILSAISKRFFHNKLKVGISNEYAPGSVSDNFPNRTFLESSYIINKYAELFVNHEILKAAHSKFRQSRMGIKGRPWKGAVVDSALSQEMADDQLRLFNHMGFQQNLKVTKHLSLNASLDKKQTIKGENKEEDFTAYALSAIYKKADWSANVKGEYKKAKENRINLDMGIYNKMSEAVGLACGVRAHKSFHSALTSQAVDAKLSVVYRPKRSLVVLNRLDFIQSRQEGYKVKKFIDYFLLTMHMNRYFELSTSYGIKYVQDTLAEEKVDSVIDTAGLEAIWHLHKKFSFGGHANILHDYESGQLESAWGAYLGFTLFKNTILALGYNVEGYHDSDFARYNHTEGGIYLQMKMKFDQESLQAYVK